MRVTLCSATLGENRRIEPPLGPLYIASALEQIGVEVDFRDYQLCSKADAFSGESLVHYLEGHEHIVLISCFVDMLPVIIDATRCLSQSRPDTIFVLGGPGPTGGARELLEYFPWITGIVLGEGEETIKEWILSGLGKRQNPIPGMVYRSNSEIVIGVKRTRIRDLDTIPLPAYHLIDWNHYTHARIITTRGCPYHCTFCDVAALWDNRSTFRNLEATIAEMEFLRDRYGNHEVAIVDDTFVLNPRRVEKFCRLLIEIGCDLKWGCFGRINLMTPTLIELMAKAGCRAIFYGIDSGSSHILKKTQKVIQRETILPVLRESSQYFDRIEASFIWGYPFETLDDFHSTLELAGEASLLAPKVNVQMHRLSPLPNSPIYHNFRGKLQMPELEDARWLLLPNILLDSRADTVREIVNSAPELFPGFYVFPTPAKEAKRHLLERSLRTLDRMIGSTIFDNQTRNLLIMDNPEFEQQFFDRFQHPADRIGVGLAIGFFNRSRRAHRGNQPVDHEGVPGLVRQRNDTKRTDILR